MTFTAIKYSPIGSTVTFQVHCEETQAVFYVKDSGIGIPIADQRQLFQTFHRASNVGKIPGTGLGLAIVRQSVELHNGTLAFESDEQQGTTFVVTLPYAQE